MNFHKIAPFALPIFASISPVLSAYTSGTIFPPLYPEGPSRLSDTRVLVRLIFLD